MLNIKFSYIITNNEKDVRLDKAITLVKPNISLRTCRRLIIQGFVRLEGFQAKASMKVRNRQQISITIPSQNSYIDLSQNTCSILTIQNSLIALYKPSGLHTAEIKGSISPSLEGILKKTVTNHSTLKSLPYKKYPIKLLNRLDQQTSGIIVAALSKKGELLWEEATSIYKYYLTIVQGKMQEPITIKNMLYTQNTLKTKSSSTKVNDDPTRHTIVTPIKIYPSAELHTLFPEAKHKNSYLTLVQCIIKKGMRHQIRAHLSKKGFPIAGDRLYGSTLTSPFLLHHYQVVSPKFKAYCLPSWLNKLYKYKTFNFPFKKNTSIL